MPFKDKQAKAAWQREYMRQYRKTHRKTLSVRPDPPVVYVTPELLDPTEHWNQTVAKPLAKAVKQKRDDIIIEQGKRFTGELSKERQAVGFNKGR